MKGKCRLARTEGHRSKSCVVCLSRMVKQQSQELMYLKRLAHAVYAYHRNIPQPVLELLVGWARQSFSGARTGFQKRVAGK